MKTETRNKRMVELRFQGWPLYKIAKRYGVSSQYVSKVVGTTGQLYKKMEREKRKEFILDNPDKTNDELAAILGVCIESIIQARAGTRYKVETINFEWEEWSISHLKKMGFSVKGMPYNHPFDLYVGEWRVNVSYAGIPNHAPSNKLVSSQWIFNVGVNKRKNCDFYFCVTACKDVFIIPSQKIPNNMGRIQFCYPTKRPSIGKYQKYHNAYYLFTSQKYNKSNYK